MKPFKLFKIEEVKTTKIVANDLKECRKYNNIGLRELSRESGVSPALISLLENGKSGVSQGTATLIEIAMLKLTQ